MAWSDGDAVVAVEGGLDVVSGAAIFGGDPSGGDGDGVGTAESEELSEAGCVGPIHCGQGRAPPVPGIMVEAGVAAPIGVSQAIAIV